MESSKKYTLIGAVIILAVIIFVILLTSLGGHGLFTRNIDYKLYFDRSVKGLNIGAPVMFRGIRIGKVKNIRLSDSETELKVDDANVCRVEVTIEIEPDQLDLDIENSNEISTMLEKKLKKQSMVEDWVYDMVSKNGMMAQLQIMSFLTGQLYIALDVTNTENNDANELERLKHHIIPTRNTTIDNLTVVLQKHNLGAMVNDIASIINDFVSSGKAREMLNNAHAISENAKQTLAEAKTLLAQINGKENAADSATIAKVNKTLDEATKLIQQLEKDEKELVVKVNGALDMAPELQAKLSKSLNRIDTLSTNLNDIVSKDGQMPQLLDNANGLISEAKKSVSTDGPALQRIFQTLNELDKTLRSLRELSDMLGRRPEVLIRGK